MKYLGIGLAFLLILLAALLFIVPSLIPSDVYKSRIEEQLSGELDREINISGDVSLSTFPVIRARTGALSISNPEGFDRDTLATIQSLEARIKLLPLIARRVEIASFTLVEPDIWLQRRADGQTNWTFATDAEPETPVSEDEPFQRDGRFADLDPSLGAFRIEDGRLTFIDETGPVRHDLTEINARLALANMESTFEMNGTMVLDGEPLDIGLELDSPRAFLDGRETRLDANLSLTGLSGSAEGVIPAGTGLGFDGAISAELSDLALVRSLLPEPVPALDLIDAASLSANLSQPSADAALTMTDLNLSAQGDAFEAQFEGSARYGESLSLNGDYQITSSNPALLGATLAPEITGLAALGTVRSAGNLTVDGETVSVRDFTANATGDTIRGDVSGNYTLRNSTLSGTGRFDVDVADAGPTLRGFVPDLPREVDLAGRLEAQGDLTAESNNFTVQNLVAQTRSDAAESRYEGGVTLRDTVVGLNGALSASIRSLAEINQGRAEPIPYADLIQSVSLSTNLSGTTDDMALNGLDLQLTDGDLNGQFSGSATVSETISLNGQLDVSSPSVRRIAEAAGTELPDATGDSEIFEAFSLSGAVSGTSEAMKLNDARLSLDDILATGQMGVSLVGSKPKLTGRLDTDVLDLRPYMDAYMAGRPAGQIEPWSEDEIPVEGLSAIDAEFDLSANAIRLSQINLGPSEADIDLTNGVLTVNIPNMTLYGGQGEGVFVLDGSGQTPEISLSAGLNRLQANSFLSAVAGFTRATGMGQTRINLTGSGNSQAAIMQSLTGTGTFGISDGAISGIDAAKFMSGLQGALTSRSLPGGLGPNEKTQFKDLVGGFTLQDGVAEIQSFSLSGAQVQMDGSGRVDLGGQTVDIRLQPKAVGEAAKGLAAFGIPLRIEGPFGASKVSLDTDSLARIVQARAAEQARNAISDRVGGPAGNILGSILGQTSPDAPTQPQETTPETTPEAAPGDEPEEEEAGESDTETPEEAIENRLRQLFGGKPKD